MREIMTGFLDNVMDSIIYYDLDQTALWANRTAGETLGLPARSLCGRTCRDIWAHSGEDCHNCPLHCARHTGREHEAEIATPDGREWRIRCRPLLSEGAVVGVAEFRQDITAKNRAERKLLMAEGMYLGFFENAVEGFYQCTPGGRLVSVNPALVSILGYDSPEDLVRRVTDIGRQCFVDPSESRAFIERLRKENVVKKMRYGHYRKDGSIITVEVSGRGVLNENGELALVEGVIQDVTGKIREEEELLRAKAAAEAADRAKSEFLGALSHELRTPLNAIIGMSDIMGETPLSDEQRMHLAAIRGAGDSLLEMINSILDFTALASEEARIEPEIFDLAGFVEEVCERPSFLARRKGLRFGIKVSETAPRRVRTDKWMLGKALGALLGNAVKFTSVGSVSLEVASRPGAKGESEIAFMVRDAGIGIPKAKRKLIFERFSQADASMTRSFGGVGLGLALCGRIASILGGAIEVESEEGRGSEFRLVVPDRPTGKDEAAKTET